MHAYTNKHAREALNKRTGHSPSMLLQMMVELQAMVSNTATDQLLLLSRLRWCFFACADTTADDR